VSPRSSIEASEKRQGRVEITDPAERHGFGGQQFRIARKTFEALSAQTWLVEFT